MENTRKAQTQWINLSVIDVPDHFREHSSEALESLTKDIQAHGLLQEIVVSLKPDGRYELVAGNGRLTAVRKLGWDQIRAQAVEGISEFDKALISIAENEEREDVSPIDKALSYKRALAVGGISQDDLAKRRGLAKSTMSEYLALADIPPELRQKLGQPNLGVAHLTEIRRLPSLDAQLILADECAKEGLTSKEVRSRVKKLLNPTGSKAKEKNPVQEDTILGCHFLYKDGSVLVKPRAYQHKVDGLKDYISDIQVGLTQFVCRLDSEPKPQETAVLAA